MSVKKSIHTDVAIIGAGYAGIAAASKLYESGKKFVVLEARDRIGGRVNTVNLSPSGCMVELGAQWIGPTQYKIWEWVKKYQVETFDCHDKGKNIYHYKNKTTSYNGTIPKMNPFALIDLGIGMTRLNKMAKTIDPEKPWESPNAEKWDGITMDTWIGKHLWTREAQKAMHVGLETVFACMASEISLLHFLFYCHSGDNLDTLLAVTNGAQHTLFKNGAQNLLEQVAQPFRKQIFLEQVVTSINQKEPEVVVSTDNLEVYAQKVIVAIPPVLAHKINYNLSLPTRKSQLLQRIPMGAAMKCYTIYDKPFWREQGYSGQIVSDRSPLHVSFDCSEPNGKGKLLFFVEGRYARDFIELPFEERRKKVIQELVYYFGDRAAKPLDYTDHCWIEEAFSGGCYTGIFPPGVWTQFGSVLRESAGNIHWAGTETAVKWNGYLDGAVESGYRAADEILKNI